MAQSSVGFFGKLPCKGDFLQRRVSQEFIEAWDPWLQRCLHASREALQERWLSCYLTSPLWRFVLSSSVCGSGAYAGVLAPSVDRVGRYFPLTLVAQIDIDISPLEFAATRADWFESLEALIAVALDESTVDLESFDAQVAGLDRPLESAGQDVAIGVFNLLEHSRFPAQGSAWRVPLGTTGGLQAAVNALAYRDLAAQLRPLSVWWSGGSDAAAASWLNLRGLPEPSGFAAMLSGQWAQHGWQDLGEWGHSPLRSQPQSQTLPATAAPPTPAAAVPASTPSLDGPVDLAAPHVTLPAVQLTDIENNRAAFVVRPEVGLWAVAAVGDPQRETTALRFIALALQQVGPAGSLTGLVEAVRQALAQVHQQLLYLSTRDVQRVEAQGQVIALLAFGSECALLCAGGVQYLRVRGRAIEDFAAPGASSGEGAGMLTDLLAADPQSTPPLGAEQFKHLHVRYERLQREDQWVLCAETLLRPRNLGDLAMIAAGGTPLSVQIIADTAAPLTLVGVVPAIMTVEM